MFVGEASVGRPEYDISHRDRITRVVLHVHPTVDLTKAIMDELVAEHPCERRLWDLSAIDLNLSAEELRQIARYSREKFSSSDRLALVASADLTYGELRMFEVFRQQDDPPTVWVFRSVAEAEAWLHSS